MTRAELEHAIRAACDIAKDTAVVVFGSQAILGQFPDAPAGLRQSVEVDLTQTQHLHPFAKNRQIAREDERSGRAIRTSNPRFKLP